MQQLLNITPHLKHVATLPCEMFVPENQRVTDTDTDSFIRNRKAKVNTV